MTTVAALSTGFRDAATRRARIGNCSRDFPTADAAHLQLTATAVRIGFLRTATLADESRLRSVARLATATTGDFHLTAHGTRGIGIRQVTAALGRGVRQVIPCSLATRTAGARRKVDAARTGGMGGQRDAARTIDRGELRTGRGRTGRKGGPVARKEVAEEKAEAGGEGEAEVAEVGAGLRRARGKLLEDKIVNGAERVCKT